MKIYNPKPILFILVLVLINSFGLGLSPLLPNYNPQQKETYIDVVNSLNGFVAITNNGRIDCISDIGEITSSKTIEQETFHCILNRPPQIIVADEKGSLIYLENYTPIKKIENNTRNSFICLSLFKERIIAADSSGDLNIENDDGSFKIIHLELKGNIVSLSSCSDLCYGVTNQGEIISTTNGTDWTIFDFNKEYSGFYKSCTFLKVETTPNQIAVIGKNIDGFPVLFFSTKGKVWSERPLSYLNDNGIYDILKETPNDICYDVATDLYILAFTNGKLMTIPSCSHCQKVYQISDENLTSISINNSRLIVVGTNKFFQIININEL